MKPISASEDPTTSAEARTKVPEPESGTVLQFERSEASFFRTLPGLAQKGGVPQKQLVKLAFKELADNALDAGGRVTFEHTDDLTWVKDDGPGIAGTDDQIADMFSFGRNVRSSKQLRLPTRGALGNGIRVVAGLVCCTGGRLAVRTRGRELDLEPLDNGDTRVRSSKPWNGNGTQVGVSFREASDDMLDWAQVAAEHDGGEGYKGSSSPFWYDSDSFFELCVAAPSGVSPRALIEKLDGCSGAKAGKIAAPFLNRRARDLSKAEASQLLVSAREHARPVKPKALGAVGEQGGFPGYGKALGSIRVSGAELPVVIESWAVASGSSTVTLMVNRTAAAAAAVSVGSYDKHVRVSGCGYAGEYLPAGGHEYQIKINVQTPHMPITSDGKAPDLTPFKKLLDDAIGLAVGRAKKAAGVIHCEPSCRRTFKDSIQRHLVKAIALASGGGKYRFNLRNLFYALRPFVMREVGELKYATFTNVVTDYENENDAVAGMFRNERGVLIHPHTRERFGLGTLMVEKYERPRWSFNKVLYVEKEGFFETLLADGWPERHDCALMTSQGYASRAARDLIDALGETNEPIEIFCVHDADAFGTQIYESLQEATRARPERKVQVVNLGLERAEAEAMGLECEDLPDAKKEKPTADYVSHADHAWYQNHRYELNAMMAGQFIAWLDAKMAKHASGKVVPPLAVLAQRLDSELRATIYEAEHARLVAEMEIGRKANDEADRRTVALKTRIDGIELEEHVRDELDEEPQSHWSEAVRNLAGELADLPSRGAL